MPDALWPRTAGPAGFTDPEHACARLAYPDYAFERVAEALGASTIDRVSTHTREKLALAGHTEIGIAYPHHPAPGIRLADNTDIAAAATLDTEAIGIVDRNNGSVTGAVAEGIYRLRVLAFRGDSGVVPALAKNSMESLARPYDTARGFAIAVDAMPCVANAPNSEATAIRAFTFHAGHLSIRRCC